MSPRLSRAEKRIADARGVLVDLRSGKPGNDDPADGRNWSAERTVSAGFLCSLIAQAGRPDRDTRAIRVRGARVTGAIDLENRDVACLIRLEDCYFDEPVILRLARAVEVALPGCHLPALRAVQADIRGNLILDRITATSVDLRGASVGGILSLDGATLDNPGGVTLAGGALTVGQGMSCGSGFTSAGTIELFDARFPQGLSFTGATLTNDTSLALDAQGMQVGAYLFLGSSLHRREGFTAKGGVRLNGVHVDGYVCCWGADIRGADRPQGPGYAILGLGLSITQNLMLSEGFRATGETYLTGVRIGAEIDLSGATLANPGGRSLTAERLDVAGSVLCTEGFTARGAVSLAGSKVGDSVDFTGAVLDEPADSAVDLRNVTAATLVARWFRPPHLADLRHATIGVLDDDPATWPARVRLRAFSYDVTQRNPGDTAAARLGWVARDIDGYMPEPYEQLISAYRRAGHEEAARKVAIASQWRRRRTLNPAAKAWNWLLYLSVGYGYRTWLAGLWLLALELAGAVIFARAYPTNITAATPHPMPFNAPVYALDVLLPIISLGQQDSWQPQGSALYAYWALTILGWALASAFIAGLAGIIKRD